MGARRQCFWAWRSQRKMKRNWDLGVEKEGSQDFCNPRGSPNFPSKLCIS